MLIFFDSMSKLALIYVYYKDRDCLMDKEVENNNNNQMQNFRWGTPSPLEDWCNTIFPLFISVGTRLNEA